MVGNIGGRQGVFSWIGWDITDRQRHRDIMLFGLPGERR